MDKKNQEKFTKIRKMVADYITKYLKEDCGHKSYEGTWEFLVSYPSYFEDETATAAPDSYQVTLHCYVLGPGRHYDWKGSSLEKVLEDCERDIRQWIRADG